MRATSQTLAAAPHGVEAAAGSGLYRHVFNLRCKRQITGNFVTSTDDLSHELVHATQQTLAAAAHGVGAASAAGTLTGGGLYRHDPAFYNLFCKTQMHSNFLASAALARMTPAGDKYDCNHARSQLDAAVSA